MDRSTIHDLIDAERDRQTTKHKTNSMEARRETIATQLVVLGKQYGQACAVAQAAIFEAEAGVRLYQCGRHVDKFRHELVSVAAVAVAMLELLDEGQGAS